MKRKLKKINIIRIIFAIFVAGSLYYGFHNFSNLIGLTELLSKISMTLEPLWIGLCLYIGLIIYQAPSYRYLNIEQSAKNLPIALPFNKRPHYKGKVYLTYNKARESLEIRNGVAFRSLKDTLQDIDDNPALHDFFEKGFKPLRVRGGIIVVPQEWIDKLEAQTLSVIFDSDTIRVVAHQKKPKHVYTGKDVESGDGAWISIKR